MVESAYRVYLVRRLIECLGRRVIRGILREVSGTVDVRNVLPPIIICNFRYVFP